MCDAVVFEVYFLILIFSFPRSLSLSLFLHISYIMTVGTICPLRVSHSAKVNIYGLPFIREMPKITGISGTDLVVKCPVAGFPIDKIKWERGKLLCVNFDFNFSIGICLLVMLFCWHQTAYHNF